MTAKTVRLGSGWIAATALALGLAVGGAANAAVITHTESVTGTGSLADASAEHAGTIGGGGLLRINGHLSLAAGGFPDNSIDLYGFAVAEDVFFQIETLPGVDDVVDPLLFLFDRIRNGRYFSSPDFTGAFYERLLPGDYWIGIGRFGLTPLDSSGFAIFDTTGLDLEGGRVPGSGALHSWLDESAAVAGDATAYTIQIKSVPEPATAGLALAALGLATAAMRRRRSTR